MASLNTLRTKGGVVLSIVIGLAMLAFILGDLLGSGGSMLNSRKMRVGEINGSNIGYVEYLNRSNSMTELAKLLWGKDAFTSQEQEGIYNMAWDQLIQELSIRPSFESIGIGVGDAEQIDMVLGAYISPVITSSFSNPQTGVFDSQYLKMFLANVDQNENSSRIWDYMKNQMTQERMMSKFNALVSAGFYASATQVEQGVALSNNSYSAKGITKSYDTIADSLVNVTSAQIREYYHANKARFKQGESRDIEYVVFDVLPSTEDYAQAKEYINQIADEFAQSNTPMQYAQLNSQNKPVEIYLKEADLNNDLAALAFGNSPATMLGPVLNNDTYTISRVADYRVLPDSLGAKHILLAGGQKERADSLVNVLRKGGDFAALSEQFSNDTNANQYGGDLGKFAPEQMIPEFSEACIAAKQGDVFVVESQYGLHVVQLYYKSAPVRKAQIATITYKIEPSTKTQQAAYEKASNLLTKSAGKYDTFKQVVTEDALSKRSVRIKNTDREINGLEGSKELVRWAFNGKLNELSTIMEINGDYIVAALTEIREEGIASVDQVATQIKAELVRQAKSKMIAEQLKGIDPMAESTDSSIKSFTVNDLTFSSFYVENAGFEPKLIGAICGGAAIDQVSKPIDGYMGVYVVTVTGDTTTGEATPGSEKVRIEATAQAYLPQRIAQVLSDQSDIKDMRVKFF